MKIFSLISSVVAVSQAVSAHHPLSELKHRYENVAGIHEVVRVNKKGKGAKDYVGRENMRKHKVKHYQQRRKNQKYSNA